ncbi:hypothetical protein Leryth_022439 [Lithospermum erythrorhizon]|nr:hypothetical protein Leryth_022439 [Lithospermum erythrorhizon]
MGGMVPAGRRVDKIRVDEYIQPQLMHQKEFLDYGTSSLGCMPCNHIFHQQCIVDWLRKSHYCPLCRFEMPTSPTDS